MEQIKFNLKKLATLLFKENMTFENKLENGKLKKEIHVTFPKKYIRIDSLSEMGSGWEGPASEMGSGWEGPASEMGSGWGETASEIGW